MVEAAGIEPASLVFEKWRRCATFVVKSKWGNEFQTNSLPCSFPWSPLESSPVLERSWQAAGQVSRRRRTEILAQRRTVQVRVADSSRNAAAAWRLVG